MNENSNLYLMHHGIKGMHWGVRRFQNDDGTLTDAGKRRYAIQDARKYYKVNRLQRARENIDNEDVKKALDGEIRRTQSRSDRKQALLSKKEIDAGREIVAKNRLNWAGANTVAKAALTAAGTYALYQNPKTRALAPLALAGGTALTIGSAKKVPYYFMENRRYKQGNEKGATKMGLSKNQQALIKAGKIAAGAALAGAAGYALYKSGAAEAAIDAGRSALMNNTSIGDYISNNKSHAASKPSSSDTSTPRKSIGQRAAEFIFTDDARNLAGKTTSRVKEAASNLTSKVKTSAKDRVKSAVRDRVMEDVDENDPRTWLKAVSNTKNAISDIQRYGRAANNLRKGDVAGAAMEVSDDIKNVGTKAVGSAKKRVDNFRNHRKNKETSNNRSKSK